MTLQEFAQSQITRIEILIAQLQSMKEELQTIANIADQTVTANDTPGDEEIEDVVPGSFPTD